MTAFRIERNGMMARVTPREKLTASEVPGLQEAIRLELEAGVRNLIFDLSETAMLDSSGIGLLIAAKNSLSGLQGSLSVVQATPEVMKLLQRMRLVQRLQVIGGER